jgi:integrase
MALFINLLDKTDLTTLPAGRHDDGLGLSLLVGKDGGSRSWTLRVKGVYRGLGSLKKVTLAQARQRRDHMRALAASAPEEPMPVAPNLSRRVPTFLERAKEVIATQTEGLKGARPAYAWERSLLHFAKPLHDKKVDAITTEDVVAVLRPIWLTKRPTARTLRKHLAKLFSSCKADKFIEYNPAALEDNLEHKLRKQKHKTRNHPAMPHAGVPAYIASLIAANTIGSLALAFTILTCVRSVEAYTARWADIDADHVWSVRSGAEMKNGLFARVPLSAKAREVLRHVKALAAANGHRGDPATFIFAGLAGEGHISSYTMLKLLQEDHPALTVHGFRASFKSWGMKFKVDRDTIEYCLHHIEGSRTEQAYMREECVEERREVLEQWATYCLPVKLRLVA